MSAKQNKKQCNFRRSRACSLPYCRAKRGKDISLFCFPKNEELKEKWAHALKFNRRITKHTFVCNLHFVDKDFGKIFGPPDSTCLRRRLRTGAVPTQNLPLFPIETDKKKVSTENSDLTFWVPKMGSTEQASSSKSDKASTPTTSARAKPLKDGQSECRVCLRAVPISCVTDIFKTWSPNFLTTPSTIAGEIGQLAGLEIKEDGNSPNICDSCFFNFRRSLLFVIDVRISEKVLKSRCHQAEVPFEKWPRPMQVDKDINEEVLGKSLNMEIKEEVMSEDDFDSNNMDEDFRPDNTDISMDIKVEPEEIVEQSLPIKITVNDPGRVVTLSDAEEFDPLQIPEAKTGRHKSRIDTVLNSSSISVDANDLDDEEFSDLYQKRKMKCSKTLYPPCNCKTKCSENISETQRRFIHKHFTNLKNSCEQCRFVLHFTEKRLAKRSRCSSQKQRETTILYYLPTTEDIYDKAKRLPVCKIMFSNTITFSHNVPRRVWALYHQIMTVRRLNQRLNERETNAKTIAVIQASGQKKNKVDITSNSTLKRKTLTDDDVDEHFSKKPRIIMERLDPLQLCKTEDNFVSYETETQEESIKTCKSDINNTKGRKQRAVNRGLRFTCNCNNQCCSKFSDSLRRTITDYYCNLKTIKQKEFLIKYTRRQLKLHRVKGKKKTEAVFTYYLPITSNFEDCERAEVCHMMFKKTVPYNIDLNKIWKEALKKARAEKKSGIFDNYVIESVCKHFKELQENKLKAMKQKIEGLHRGPIKRLTFSKMYKLYCKWINSTKCIHKVDTLRQYERIVVENIPRDHILTLQQGNSNLSKDLQINDKIKTTECLELKQEKKVESRDHNLILDETIQSYGWNVTEVEIETNNPEEKVSDSERLIDGEDIPDNVSDHSNFSDDLKKEFDENKIKIIKEDSQVSQDELNNKDVTSSDESDNITLQDIKTEVNSKKSTRNNPIGELVGMPKEAVVYDGHQNADLLLTEKRKLPTRDSGVIRKYNKYHGLPYVDYQGNLVPKKQLGPPCYCHKMKCHEKISEDQRKYIFDQFYSLGTKQKQHEFALKFTERLNPHKTAKGRITFRVKYFLPLTKDFESDKRAYVCEIMFNNTVAQNSLGRKAWNEYNKKHPIQLPNLEREKRKRQYCNKDEQGNTLIDFVYRAMPFDEYMAHFATKKDTSKLDVAPVGDETEQPKNVKKVKKKICKRTAFKNQRMLGKRYLSRSGKIVSAKMLGPPCNCGLLKCYEKINDEQRKYVFDYYWGLTDIALKRAFIVRFSALEDVKRRYRGKCLSVIRDYTIYYYLPLTSDFNGERLRVCKTMFQNTLSICSSSIYVSWDKYHKGSFKEARGNYSTGIRQFLNKVMVTSVLDHFNFLEQEGVLKKYKGKGPSGEYFQFNNMYKLYLEWFDPTKYSDKVKKARHYKMILKGNYMKYMIAETNEGEQESTSLNQRTEILDAVASIS